MDPNTGSFGANLGGIDALKESMARRGMDSSILDQVSGSAPTGPSQVAPSVQEGAGMQPQPVGSQAQPTQTPQAPEQEFRSAEMGIALKALKGVVDTENKVAVSALKLQGLV